MDIQWYPGHMAKASRKIAEDLKKVDCAVYVLDARIPRSSINPVCDELLRAVPRLYVLNKADLVEPDDLRLWRRRLSRDGNLCIARDSRHRGDAASFVRSLREVCRPILDRYARKGARKSIRAMVIGVPNCGKSALINSLAPKKKAATGDKPGVTRGAQWVSIDPYVDLLDTPGVLYPNLSDPKTALNLAMAGCINDLALDRAELAIEIAKMLLKRENRAFASRYFPTGPASDGDLLKTIAEKRGFLLKNGVPDEERAAGSVISELRQGAYGKIVLDDPDDCESDPAPANGAIRSDLRQCSRDDCESDAAPENG